MQYLSVVLPVAAMVSGALASPAWNSWSDDCLAAVTGSAALGDAGLRASHCKSYLATTVTPIATETVYITGNANDNWKRSTVAYCPNEVPNYASACDDAHYTSACSVFGYTDVITTTVAPTTTTKTIWVKPTGGAGSCSTSTVTKAGSTTTVTVGAGTTVTSTSTVTSTVGGATTVTSTVTSTVKEGGSGTYSATTVTSTVTVSGTVTGTTVTSTVSGTCTTSSATASSCKVDDALATKLVENFENLLEFTNGPGGRGYNQAISDATLATDFVDISDSINFMSGVPLGAVSFTSKAQFDSNNGQAGQPEVQLDALNIWHDCESVTWRWRISSLPFPVTGISHFTVNDDKLIQKNWVEFDNGAWLQSYGQNCSFGSGAGAPPPQVVTPPASKRGVLVY
ncbi:hypothetical protein H2200_000195 [Cladophialophora chaetospira]|uniref:NTF2-like domain-containing protein n=1 Tax=Cladophialophora chaetospira TaxID=386627 RepID=A0AA38XNU1_9EURO|nr:hypothetical protein H2200_000195 [Cladophialophora chaetospira]